LDTALGDGQMAPWQDLRLGASGSPQPALHDRVSGHQEKVRCWWGTGSGGPHQPVSRVREGAGWCAGSGWFWVDVVGPCSPQTGGQQAGGAACVLHRLSPSWAVGLGLSGVMLSQQGQDTGCPWLDRRTCPCYAVWAAPGAAGPPQCLGDTKASRSSAMSGLLGDGGDRGSWGPLGPLPWGSLRSGDVGTCFCHTRAL